MGRTLNSEAAVGGGDCVFRLAGGVGCGCRD